MPDTKIDIAKLRGLLEKATKTPWKWVRHSEEDKPFYESEWRIAPGILTPDGSSGTPGGDEIDRANAMLVLAAVNALPSLLTQLEQSQREVERLSKPRVEWQQQGSEAMRSLLLPLF